MSQKRIPRETPHVRIAAHDRTESYEALRGIAPGGVLDRWQSGDRPDARIVAVLDQDSERWLGAALVTARPHTAYLKIVDVVGDVPAVVDAVVTYARDARKVQVKWEGWTAGSAPGANGFTALTPPSAADATQPATGYVRWLTGNGIPEPAYSRQTTHFTCGPVAALIAHSDAAANNSEPVDRSAELTLWRDATNHPACEPVGLGVAVRRRWPESTVTVSLDATGPVLLDSFPAGERSWRAVLQQLSRDDAATLGVSISEDRISIADMRAALTDGRRILLLISLEKMLGFAVPHWVLCHGAVPGAIVVEDPWINDATGETWLDTHLLAISDAALDAMSLIDGRYRGAVGISNR